MKMSYDENYRSYRPDGRHISTMAAHMQQLRELSPKLALPENLTKESFYEWKSRVREKLEELLLMPEFTFQPEPVFLSKEKRDGYTLEKWEFYPDSYSVVPFLMLVPDGVDESSPAPAVLCFPGSANSKEFASGEPKPEGVRYSQGKYIAQNKMVAFVFDNLETAEIAAERDSLGESRHQMCHGLLMSGTCYPGLSVFQKLCFMKHIDKWRFVDRTRLAISGHSLGTETGLFLFLLCDEFKALIFNDMMVDHRHRYVAVTETEDRMDQDIGNWHIVPGMFNWFDFPDLAAAVAPKYLAINEGGGEYYVEKIRRAYKAVGAEDRFQVTQYPKYTAEESRCCHTLHPMKGMTLEQWRAHNYVDAPDHSYREKPSIELLKKCFGLE